MKKRYEINMTKGPLLPELLQFILPLMLSSMLQIAFNAADLIVVGRFGRPHSMAAVGANGAMINLIINVLMGLATGGGVLCARYYGANQTDKLHRTVSTTLITGVIGGVITGALGLALTVPLLVVTAVFAALLAGAAVGYRRECIWLLDGHLTLRRQRGFHLHEICVLCPAPALTALRSPWAAAVERGSDSSKNLPLPVTFLIRAK